MKLKIVSIETLLTLSLLTYNRNVNKKHVLRIAQEMYRKIIKRSFGSRLFVVEVNKNNKIIDGQHRVLAALLLKKMYPTLDWAMNLLIYDINDEDANIEARIINTTSKKWNGYDFIESRSKKNLNYYQLLQSIEILSDLFDNPNYSYTHISKTTEKVRIPISDTVEASNFRFNKGNFYQAACNYSGVLRKYGKSGTLTESLGAICKGNKGNGVFEYDPYFSNEKYWDKEDFNKVLSDLSLDPVDSLRILKEVDDLFSLTLKEFTIYQKELEEKSLENVLSEISLIKFKCIDS